MVTPAFACDAGAGEGCRAEAQRSRAMSPFAARASARQANFDEPKTSGYLSLVRLQSAAPITPVAKWYGNSRVVPYPSIFCRGKCRDVSTATLNHGGRMAHNDQNWDESKFEITSKRRKGFPSETQVKRGVRIVHGNKELSEKLGRNDLCPCGSGRRF